MIAEMKHFDWSRISLLLVLIIARSKYYTATILLQLSIIFTKTKTAAGPKRSLLVWNVQTNGPTSHA